MSHIRVIFFDIGGTLIHPHPSFHGVIVRVLGEHGVVTTCEEVAAVEPQVWQASETHQDGGYVARSDAESREFWYRYYAALLELLDVTDPRGLSRALYAEFVKHTTYRLYADSLPALKALRDCGILLGVISNWEKWLEQLLRHLDIDSFFSSTAISGHVGVEKPDPRIFALALHTLGLAPHEAVHVGDSVFHDVGGARAAGLVPVLVDRLGQHPPGDCLRVSALTDLPELLNLDGWRRPRVTLDV